MENILVAIVDLTVALYIRKSCLVEDDSHNHVSDEVKIIELQQMLDKKIDEYEEEIIELAQREGHKRAIRVAAEYEILLNKMINDQLSKLTLVENE